MSSLSIIADQWDCLTEPERAIANQMTDNLSLGTAFIGKTVADGLWADARGAGWEIYRDQFLANWNCYEASITILGIELTAYATIAGWPFGIIICRGDGGCGPVPIRCRAVRGFP